MFDGETTTNVYQDDYRNDLGVNGGEVSETLSLNLTVAHIISQTTGYDSHIKDQGCTLKLKYLSFLSLRCLKPLPQLDIAKTHNFHVM